MKLQKEKSMKMKIRGIVGMLLGAALMPVNADIVANLLEDPGFENLAAGEPTQVSIPWYDSMSAAQVHIEVQNYYSNFGTNSLVFRHYGRTGFLGQKLGVQVEADTSYELGVWMRIDEASTSPAQTNSSSINMTLAASDTEGGTYDWTGIANKDTIPTVAGEWQYFMAVIDSSSLTNFVGDWIEVRFVKELLNSQYKIYLDDITFGVQATEPSTNSLVAISDDFDYGSANFSEIPNWYDGSAFNPFYNGEGGSNSPFDFDTGEVGFTAGGGTNQYMYRSIGGYSGEKYITYSLNISTWNSVTADRSGELLVRIFKNNVFSPSEGVDVASDVNSVLVDGDTRPYVSPGSNSIVNLTGTLDLSGASLSIGDKLYFEITYSNPDSRDMVMDDVELFLPEYEIGSMSWQMLNADELAFSWEGSSDVVFTLQTDENLVEAPGWSNLVEGIEGMAGMMSVTTDTSRAQSFYRIIAE
jgi:hypothetical protein